MNLRRFLSALRFAIFFLIIVMSCVVAANAAGDLPEVGDIAARKTPSSTKFKILTNAGFVAFTADSGWQVIAVQSHLPVAVMGFQILNSADDGTPDSTNLAISLYDMSAEKGRGAFATSVKTWGEGAPSVETIGPWRVFRQESRQGSTSYSVLDAQRSEVADVAVSVRLSWPHLVNNAATYDADMEAAFRRFIASVYGGTGPYSPEEGEVVRRPAK